VFRSILLPWDGTAEGEKVLGPARSLLGGAGRFLVARVVDAPHGDVEGATRQARQELADLTDRHAGDGLEIGTEAVVGEPVERILELIDLRAPDLVVLGTHGRTGLERWLLGSVSESVLRETGAPLLVVNVTRFEEEADASWRPIRRVVVPLDGTGRSSAVSSLLLELPGAPQFEVVVVHTPGPDPTDAVPPERGRPDAETVESPGAVNVSADVSDLETAGFRVRARIGTGAPADVILDALEEEEPDFAVLWSHARAGLSRALFGSVAEDVARRSPVPVLVQSVKTPE